MTLATTASVRKDFCLSTVRENGLVRQQILLLPSKATVALLGYNYWETKRENSRKPSKTHLFT